MLVKIHCFFLTEEVDSGGFITVALGASLQENQIPSLSLLNSYTVLNRFLI